MYKLIVVFCFLSVASAFIDRNVQDFERRKVIEERNREEAERRRQAEEIVSQHRFYRSVSLDDFEPGLDLADMYEPLTFNRHRRSQLPNVGGANIEKIGGNTVGTINVGRRTDRYDVGATWSKVLHGPNKAKPNFSIGGTYRW